MFLNGLSSEMHTARGAFGDEPLTWAEVCVHLQKVEDRIHDIAAAKRNVTGRARPATSTLTNSASYARTAATPAPVPTSQSSTASTTCASSSASQGDPADPSTASRPSGPLTEQEKERCRALGLCSYCGAAGHFRANCQAAQAASKRNALKLKTTTVT
jgi:hypothetical protein